MIRTLVHSDGRISLNSSRIGSLLVARRHLHGGYYIYWWYGAGRCFEYVGRFTDLLSIANAEELRHWKEDNGLGSWSAYFGRHGV